MSFSVFIRLQGRLGQGDAIAAAIREVVTATRAEAGCLFIESYQATRHAGLFHIHSVWVDEAAFNVHAGLPHTVHFLATVEVLIDPAIEVSRVLPLSSSGSAS